ncbi:hypothetical protein BDF22DRAFT_657292 [Syncephalis plumigaleata]|nr:hypothetical protein BDF22DRAFT_657292 [Syncephalis plumigaleata]
MHFLSTVVSAMLISACTLTGAAPSDKGEAIRIIAAKEELKQMCLQILGSSPAFMAFDDTKYYAISFGYKNKCLALASETTTSLADCNLNDSNQHWHFSDGPKDDKYPDNKLMFTALSSKSTCHC